MVDLYPRQPLYAFVSFKIGGNVISSLDGYIYQGDNGGSQYDFLSANAGLVIGLNVERSGESGSVMSNYTLTLFDDTAIYAEAIVAEAYSTHNGANDTVDIEYGWASRGQKIQDRSFAFKGNISMYSVSFSGPSVTLEIQGTGEEVPALNEGGVECYDAKTYNGSPSEIVKAIADSYGWVYDSESIVDTIPIKDEVNNQMNATFLQGGRTVQQFIEQDLVPFAMSTSGRNGYSFWIEPLEDGGKKVHFQPGDSYVSSTYTSQILDGMGASEITTMTAPTAEYGEAKAKCVRQFDYYTGKVNNEIIEFTPQYSALPEIGMSSGIMSVDSAGEVMACKTESNGNNIDSDGMKMAGTGASRSRLMGISSTTYQRLELASKYLWEVYAKLAVTADMTILGDPKLQVMDKVEINVYTKYGFRHHTSGIYTINTISDSIDAGSFTTTLSLIRDVIDVGDPGQYNGFGEGTTEAPGATDTKVKKPKKNTTVTKIPEKDPVTGDLYPEPITDDWLSIALSQVGANMKDGSFEKYLKGLNLPESSSWDTAFVSWVMDKSGNHVFEQTGSCKELLQQAKDKGRFMEKSVMPRVGDIFIQAENNASHTGFVASIDGSKGSYTTVEGNSPDKVRIVERLFNDPLLTGFYSLKL